MSSYSSRLTHYLIILAGIFFTPIVLAANPLPAEQAAELGKLYQTYSMHSEAAIAAHKQAEIQQTEIVTQQARVVDLQGKADRAESELMLLQEFDRKKPGKVKPEELEAARSNNLQAQAEVENAQHQLEQQQSNLSQLKEVLAKKNLATESGITTYRRRFAALATEAVTRRVNSYKIAQQITESANVPCEELTLSACKAKTQQEVQRRAIEKGAIIVVDSITEIKNLTLQKDEVRSEVHGEITNLKILETRLTDEPATYHMKIQATVTPVIGDSLLAEIQRTVLADMSLQVGDSGLAFKSPESMILAPMEVGAIPIMSSPYKLKRFAPLLKKAQAGDAQAQYEVAVMYQYGLDSIKVNLEKAFKWYSKAAEQGQSDAEAGLALFYFGDLGIQKDLPKAIALLNKSADKGDALAQFYLSGRYSNGNGVEKDEEESKKLFAKALPTLEKMAQRGDPLAQWLVATAYFGMKDEANAFMWLERAARQGNVYAQHELGRRNGNGSGVAKNETNAFEWIQKAALQGFPFAQYDLGDMYRRGTGVTISQTKAFEWIKKSALQGIRWAQLDIGKMYKKGAGTTKDEGKAFEWFEKAALQGDSQAQLYLGELYEKAGNYTKAFEWYERGYENSPRTGLFNLGLMYLYGKGVAKNEAKAFELIERYASDMLYSLIDDEFDSGKILKAKYQLGLMYLYGKGVPKNETKAFELIYQVALLDETDINAQTYLGWMYLNGVGVTKNEARAFYFSEKAALKGEVGAQTRLGMMYLNGYGIAKNAAEAVKWFEKASIQGGGEAQFLFGLSYQDGVGVQKDLVLSYAWLNLAAAQGQKDAGAARDLIKLNASEKAEAERLSSKWKPGSTLRRGKK